MSLIAVLVAVVAGVLGYFFDPLAGLLFFCISMWAAWLFSPDLELFSSYAGLIAIVVVVGWFASVGSMNVNVWVVAKLVFVLFFGLFANNALERLPLKVGHKLCLMGFLMFLAVAAKILTSGQSSTDACVTQCLSGPESAYKWSDWFEDLSFGLAGVFASVLAKK